MEEDDKDKTGEKDQKDQSTFVRYFCDNYAILSKEQIKELCRFLETTPKASNLCLELLVVIRDSVITTLKEKSRYMGILLEHLLLPLLSLMKNKSSMIFIHVYLCFQC